MAINYRKAETDDIPELVQLRLDFLNDPSKKPVSAAANEILRVTNNEYIASSLLDGSLVIFVAEDYGKGKIVGTSGIMFERRFPNPGSLDGRKAHIANMYTLPEYRGKGIATALMKLQLEEAKIRGVNYISLSATEMGRKVYEKIGFETDEEEMKIKL
jgi:GNAT superfamily N-acetyltransferase